MRALFTEEWLALSELCEARVTQANTDGDQETAEWYATLARACRANTRDSHGGHSSSSPSLKSSSGPLDPDPVRCPRVDGQGRQCVLARHIGPCTFPDLTPGPCNGDHCERCGHTCPEYDHCPGCDGDHL